MDIRLTQKDSDKICRVIRVYMEKLEEERGHLAKIKRSTEDESNPVFNLIKKLGDGDKDNGFKNFTMHHLDMDITEVTKKINECESMLLLLMEGSEGETNEV